MTTSMYFSLMAVAFVAPHIGPKAAAVGWALATVAGAFFIGKS